MPVEDKRPEQILELWENFLSAKLDDRGAAKLVAWLEANPQELDACRREAALSVSLSYLLQPETEGKRFAQSIQVRLVGKSAGKDSGRLKHSVMEQLHGLRSTPRHARRPVRRAAPAFNWLYAAAALFAVAALAWFALHGAGKPAEKTNVVVKQPIAPAVPTPTPIPIPTPAPAPVATAKVRLDEGSGSADGRLLVAAQSVELKAGSQIDLQPNAKGLLTLADGSTFKLVDESSLTLSAIDHGALLRLKRGRVEVRAQHQERGDKLVVETPHAAVTVVGTEYTIDAFSDRSHVAVQNGTVSVVPNAKATGAQALTLGEELWADTAGLGSVRKSTQRRVLPMSEMALEEFIDPLKTTDTPNAFFGDLPVRHLSYTHPARAKWYAGVLWPVKLTAEENHYEVWVRPKVSQLRPRFDAMLVSIMLQEGDTEYVAGQIELKPGDTGWRVLTGSVKDAFVNWVRPGTKQLPARADLAEHLALRVCNGDIELDYTPIIVWK